MERRKKARGTHLVVRLLAPASRFSAAAGGAGRPTTVVVVVVVATPEGDDDDDEAAGQGKADDNTQNLERRIRRCLARAGGSAPNRPRKVRRPDGAQTTARPGQAAGLAASNTGRTGFGRQQWRTQSKWSRRFRTRATLLLQLLARNRRPRPRQIRRRWPRRGISQRKLKLIKRASVVRRLLPACWFVRM